MKKRKVTIDFLKVDIYLFQCDFKNLLKEASKEITGEKLDVLKKEYNVFSQDGYTLGFQIALGSGTSLIWLHPSAKSRTLIHEIVHSVHYIFREREIPLSEDTEEVAAYMIEYICNELLLT